MIEAPPYIAPAKTATDNRAAEKSVRDSARSRVSIRKYSPDPILPEEIYEILELAGKAPSAFNVQPWRFIAVTNHELKQTIQAAAYNQAQVGSATVLLVLTSDMKDALARVEDFISPAIQGEARDGLKKRILGSFESMPEEARHAWGRGQTYIALGYLLLTLESLGYGSSPMLGFDQDKVREILGLERHVEIPALVAFGRPAETGFPQFRLPVQSVTQIIE